MPAHWRPLRWPSALLCLTGWWLEGHIAASGSEASADWLVYGWRSAVLLVIATTGSLLVTSGAHGHTGRQADELLQEIRMLRDELRAKRQREVETLPQKVGATIWTFNGPSESVC